MRSKKAIKNIVSSLLLQIITIICGLILPRAIIENYGSSVNGLISSITQFLSYITLLEAGIGPVIKSVLYKPIANKDKNQIESILKAAQKFFRVISYIFIVYLILLCFIFPLIVKKEFSTMYTISLILIISISTFAEYFLGMIYKLYLQSEQKTYVTSNIQIITVILNTILSVTLIKFGANIQIVKLVSAFIFVFRPIAQNIYVRKKYNINLNNVKDNYELKQKWDGLAQHIAAVIHGNTDIAVLTIFTSTAEVSVYTVYLFVVNGVKNIIQAFTGGIDALFGDMYARNEHENMNKKFKIYEFFYFTITTIIFSSTLVLILPFIQVYTRGITDVNYYRPLFAYLIVIAEYVWAIRLPYSSIILSTGHFKETKKGAWIEAGTNIVLSVILVMKFGIVGVAIGTFVAMLIRTIEFMIHTSKYILKRNMIHSFKWLIIICVETIIICVTNYLFPNNNEITTYIDWFIYAIITTGITSITILIINCILYKNDAKEVIKLFKNFKK